MIVKTVLASVRQSAGRDDPHHGDGHREHEHRRAHQPLGQGQSMPREEEQPADEGRDDEEGDATPRAWREDADRQQDDEAPERDGTRDGVEALHPRVGGVLETGTEAQGHATSLGDATAYPVRVAKQWRRPDNLSRMAKQTSIVDTVVGLDSSIILPRETWVASGHVGTFTDPLVECLSCHKRRRQDHLQEALAEKKGIEDPDSIPMSDIVCPDCGTKGQWTAPREFNMMLKTYLGVIEDESGLHYLRPETAQGIFVNFNNVMQASRKKPPFGIAQTGKSFRNEITPGNFIFRTREFEQMEMEFFVKPGE